MVFSGVLWLPMFADRDGDGLGDACDPCPFDLDVDGDGLCADQEAQVPLSSLDLPCPDGWFLFTDVEAEEDSDSCWYVSTDSLTWPQARDRCVALGGHLATSSAVNSDVGLFTAICFITCMPA